MPKIDKEMAQFEKDLLQSMRPCTRPRRSRRASVAGLLAV